MIDASTAQKHLTELYRQVPERLRENVRKHIDKRLSQSTIRIDISLELPNCALSGYIGLYVFKH